MKLIFLLHQAKLYLLINLLANNIILDISNQRQKQYSDETWNYLYELSLETFVEDSEEKKLSGAGAGLTDND